MCGDGADDQLRGHGDCGGQPAGEEGIPGQALPLQLPVRPLQPPGRPASRGRQDQIGGRVGYLLLVSTLIILQVKSLSLGLKETYSSDNVEASLGVMRRILACFDSCRLPYPAPSTWPFYLSCASLHSRQASTIVFFMHSSINNLLFNPLPQAGGPGCGPGVSGEGGGAVPAVQGRDPPRPRQDQEVQSCTGTEAGQHAAEEWRELK